MFDELFESPPVSMDELEWSDAERAMLDPIRDGERHAVPSGVDHLLPGPVLAAYLSTIDVIAVSGYDRVVALRAHQKLASHYTAAVYADMAAISDHMYQIDGDFELADEAAGLEVRAALKLTRRAADREMGLANTLTHRIPRVGEALARGDIDLRRARVIAYGTTHLDGETARIVVDRVIESASRLTSGQLHARVRRLCVEADPEDAKSRYEQALEERKVVGEATEDGTANIWVENAAPDRVAAALAHINHMARRAKSPDDERSIDQIRADVALDMLTGRISHNNHGRGSVDLVVDLTTLTGLTENPGELSGYGPVIADIARQVTEQQTTAEWRWTVTDPDTGMVVHNGTTKRRPTPTQQRQVQACNRTCVFPGCRTPAVDCDIDHRKPWAQTHHTKTDELAPLCRHDHCRRHLFFWTYQPLPGGDHLWTSRLGHNYTTSGRSPPDTS